MESTCSVVHQHNCRAPGRARVYLGSGSVVAFTLDKRITGVFAGVISQGKPEDYMMAPNLKIAVLTLDSVEDILIEPIPSAK